MAGGLLFRDFEHGLVESAPFVLVAGLDIQVYVEATQNVGVGT